MHDIEKTPITMPAGGAAFAPSFPAPPREASDKSKVSKTRRLLTLEEFRTRYANRRDGYKYELNKGLVEKTPSNMNIFQAHIVKNLTRRFAQTKEYSAGAELMPELDQTTMPGQSRRPDLTYVALEQISSQDENVSPFVIEILSPNDKVQKVDEKIEEYFATGVKVLWHIHPKLEKVEVYTSPFDIKVCKGDMECSAAPVLPDFVMAAKDVFKKTAS